MNRSRVRRSVPAVFALLLLFFLLPRAFAAGDIPIVVDGLPLDAKAIAVRNEVYVPAWILENYAHTKVRWIRGGNSILEIVTVSPEGSGSPQEGTIRFKIGFYLESEGYVVGKNARVYLLNVDPKEFRFPDGKTPSDRAHEGAVDRAGGNSEAMKEYLTLPPTERFSPKGWKIVARMPKEEIAVLPATVDRYELLYKALFYDLLTNLVVEREAQLKSLIIDENLKGMKVERLPVTDDGTTQVKLTSGLYFVFSRILYNNRQVVWDIPLAVRGGDILIELSHRNAALMQ